MDNSEIYSIKLGSFKSLEPKYPNNINSKILDIIINKRCSVSKLKLLDLNLVDINPNATVNNKDVITDLDNIYINIILKI